MPRIDWIGRKYGRLTVIEDVGDRYLKCLCECGKETRVFSGNLSAGRTKSCGCLNDEIRGKSSITHGKSHSRVWNVWAGMIQRCEDKKCQSYHRYGKRGIRVCTEWRESFERFYEDMGEGAVGMSIDRIDNMKGYFKENCRWATLKQQARNKRNNRTVIYNGEEKTLVEWCEILGLYYDTIKSRLLRGATPEEAFVKGRMKRR